MPWVPLDTHWLRDPRIQAAAAVTPFALSAFPAILAAAKQVAQAGRVEIAYRDLAHDLFISTDEARSAVDALVESGVLECHDSSQLVTDGHNSSHPVATLVGFRPGPWKRWNDLSRKAKSRAGGAA